MAKAVFGYKYLAVWILFVCMLIMYGFDYKEVENIIHTNNHDKKAMVEKNVLDSLMHVDRSYKILEKFLNEDMKHITHQLYAKYTEIPDVYEWDLEEIQKEYPDYDFYIIDEDLVVVRTTMSKDLGLDFKQFPNFAQLLKKRMSGDSFHADRMDFSTTTHTFKKYSYMPTPDHKYLLELSIDIHNVFPATQDINIFKHADTLVRENDVVRDISFYKTNDNGSDIGLVTHGEGPYLNTDLSEDVAGLVQKTVLSNESVVTTNPEIDISKKYIPYLTYEDGGQLDWWNSYVVGISYDDGILKANVSQQQQALVIKIVILVVMFVFLNMVIAYQLRRTKELSSRDSVTLLPNRNYFETYFARQTAQECYKSGQSQVAILFIDLDNFKYINDYYGHDIGDKVLIEIAFILQSNLRKDDLVIRSGGDEFWVMLSNIQSESDTLFVLEKICESLKNPLYIETHTILIQASIGVSIYPEAGKSLHEIIHHADKAMYQAKQQKDERTRWVLYAGPVS